MTVSGKTNLLAEIEKVGFLLCMDSINTRLCCSTSSQSIGYFLELDSVISAIGSPCFFYSHFWFVAGS